MSAIRVEQRVSGTRRWTIALLALSVLVYAQSGEAADGIKFFKNYFVTGDYVTGSVDLLPQSAVAGRVTGTIPITGVPANADILAALRRASWRGQFTGVDWERGGEEAPLAQLIEFVSRAA